jgi:hypothetical protein
MGEKVSHPHQEHGEYASREDTAAGIEHLHGEEAEEHPEADSNEEYCARTH